MSKMIYMLSFLLAQWASSIWKRLGNCIWRHKSELFTSSLRISWVAVAYSPSVNASAARGTDLIAFYMPYYKEQLEFARISWYIRRHTCMSRSHCATCGLPAWFFLVSAIALAARDDSPTFFPFTRGSDLRFATAQYRRRKWSKDFTISRWCDIPSLHA